MPARVVLDHPTKMSTTLPQPATLAFSRMASRRGPCNNLNTSAALDILAIAVEAAGLWAPATKSTSGPDDNGPRSVEGEVSLPPVLPLHSVVVPLLEDTDAGKGPQDPVGSLGGVGDAMQVRDT